MAPGARNRLGWADLDWLKPHNIVLVKLILKIHSRWKEKARLGGAAHPSLGSDGGVRPS